MEVTKCVRVLYTIPVSSLSLNVYGIYFINQISAFVRKIVLFHSCML